jgi:Protein of unknown function (DUF4238)
MPSDLMKLQHYVPRFYLKTWAKSHKLWVLQDGKVYRNSVRNVAAQNYFYRLNELSVDDIEFVRKMAIESSPEKLRPGHEYLLHAFTLPHQAKRRIERSGNYTPEFQQILNEMITNSNEQYHSSIESRLKPQIASLIAGDLGFLNDTDQAVTFYHGLAVQILRTNSMKRAKTIFRPDQYELYLRTAPLLMHILAVNMGLNLWVERSLSEIVLLQPIINLAANPTETAPPTDFDLYYPLSPKRAMMLLMPNSGRRPASPSVTGEAVHMYNLSMAAHSNYQIFASEPSELEAIKKELPAYLSCFEAK